MEWIGTVSETPVIVPEGTYNAVLSNILPDESNGKPLVRLNFTITDGAFEGNEVSGLCTDIINQVSKLGRWIKAITGSVPNIGENIRASSLIGKDCRITVTHTKKDDGITFANVNNVMPISGKDTE